MSSPTRSPESSTASSHLRSQHAPLIGLVFAVALMALAMLIPAVTGWYVHVNSFPPLHAQWDPRVGWSTPVALLVAVGATAYSARLALTLSWRWLLVAVFVGGLAWMLSLALIDGSSGIGHILETQYEYLGTARSTTDIVARFHEYIGRIPVSAAPNNFPVHIAGHPAGALLFFVVLVRLGLGAAVASGLVVTVFAASTAVAVLLTARTLGAAALARKAAPFLVFGPAAIWQCVSADAMFAAVAAWGIAALAVASTRRSVVWSVVAGLLLGYAVMLSYGLPLLGVLAIGVLVAGRSFFPLGFAVVAAAAVVLAFAVAGFSWWEAYPVLQERYYDGVGGRRPWSYWMWGDLAALCFSAGPMLGAGVAQLLSGAGGYLRSARTRSIALLTGSGMLMVLAADLSQLSRAEVERIWLPFVPWVLLSCALMPPRWRRIGLVVQVVTALVVAHLLKPDW